MRDSVIAADHFGLGVVAAGGPVGLALFGEVAAMMRPRWCGERTW
jgi:hypothetical protein